MWWASSTAASSAADIDDVGCPEPAAAAHRTASTRSCWASSDRLRRGGATGLMRCPYPRTGPANRATGPAGLAWRARPAPPAGGAPAPATLVEPLLAPPVSPLLAPVGPVRPPVGPVRPAVLGPLRGAVLGPLRGACAGTRIAATPGPIASTLAT